MRDTRRDFPHQLSTTIIRDNHAVYVVATVLLVRLSGRIYLNTILRPGARVRLSEALRAREPAVT